MKGLVVLVPALLLFGCCAYFGGCPRYADPPRWYYGQCAEKGGHIQSDTDSLTLCQGPPYCADSNGNHIEITEPTPTPTVAPTITPTPVPDGLREARCVSSGGSWNYGYCDCQGLAYNYTSGECYRCPEGQLVGRGLGPAFCYTPTGKQGMPCDRSTDCNGGSCVLVNASASVGKGECHDLPFGCFVRIDGSGNFNPDEVLCVD